MKLIFLSRALFKLYYIFQRTHNNHIPNNKITMLAPSYRQKTKRERGISLSRTSSHHKMNHSVNPKINDCLSQSFECYEPSHKINQDHNFQTQSVLKQRNQNRMSIMPQKYKSSRQGKPQIQSHSRKGSTMRSKQNTLSESSFHLGHSLQTDSIHQMIDLLAEYQKQCQREMDLESAEEARKRINQLKIEDIKTRRKELEVEGKEYIIKTRREGQVEKREFYEFWDSKILEARQALMEIEEKHLQEQRKELAEYERKVQLQTAPSIKYSSKVLETRRNLTSLIKSRKYKEAEHLKELLAKREAEEQEKWVGVCQEKKNLKIKEFKKKQQLELEAFRLKLNSSFNQLVKEKEKQEERMSKKMKKMEVEAGKVPASIVKARQDLLNQSKANLETPNSNY